MVEHRGDNRVHAVSTQMGLPRISESMVLQPVQLQDLLKQKQEEKPPKETLLPTLTQLFFFVPNINLKG